MNSDTVMSQALVKSFAAGHQAILCATDAVYLLLRSYNQAKPKLRELDALISTHLARQNKRMYGRLAHQYKSDRVHQKTLEFLVHDLKDLKIKYLIFFDQHSGEMGDHNSRSFPLNFQRFTQEIVDRMQIEEEYLFPLLAELPVEQFDSSSF